MVKDLNFEDFADRLPPQNIEAEESILGGILLDPAAISQVAEILEPDAFSIQSHKIIYRAALTLHESGKPTDLMSVTTWLADRKLLEKVGGQSKLAQLVDRTVSAVNIEQYAELVIDKYIRRKLIHAGHQIVQIGYETATELETVIDKAEQTIFNIAQDRPQQGLIPISDTLINTFQDIESLHQGTALPGLNCSFYDLDAMTGGFQRSDLIIIAGRPSMGKCCAASSEIVLADGSIATIAEICQKQQASLLTLKDNWKFELTQPSAFINDDIKPVFRLTTRLGRYIETTITHPYLTIAGWRPLIELKPGDKIAVPRKIDIFGTETLRDYEVKLLAYLIGDDFLTDHNTEITNSNSLMPQEFAKYIVNIPGLREKLEDWNENARSKTIPTVVFKLNKRQIALFLNRLFTTDGWAIVDECSQAQLGYTTISEKLARQIQHLLLRFGIIAALRKQNSVQDKKYQLWQVIINDAESIKNFIQEIGIFGKKAALLKVQESLNREEYPANLDDVIPVEIWQQIAVVKGDEPWTVLAQRAGIEEHNHTRVGNQAPTREGLMTIATALKNLPLQELAIGDVYWDEIVAIEPLGYKQVYDLTIPETHNFIANDICVHNTSFAVNIGLDIAKFHNLPVAIFSLEMSKEQLAQRLLANESGIESNRLRAGRVSQNEWEPLTAAIGNLSELPIFIDDTANISVTSMRSQARRLQSENGGKLGLILIDYLQLMEGGNTDNRVQELSKITRSLKALAREFSVPVIALSQLSRGVESRTNKRPMLSDLRESGSIEQDADIVIMLYRDEYYSPDTPDRGIAEIIIAKHRNGPTGTVKLIFNPQFTQFRSLARTTT